MSVTVRVAAAKPIPPLRASQRGCREPKRAVTATANDSPQGGKKAKQVEQHEDDDAEAKCQCRRIHRPARSALLAGKYNVTVMVSYAGVA